MSTLRKDGGLRRPTADTALIVDAALRGMREIYMPGLNMAKAPNGANMYGRDNTFGGYSDVIVVNEDFALKIPKNLNTSGPRSSR